jgi:hypothetical protein
LTTSCRLICPLFVRTIVQRMNRWWPESLISSSHRYRPFEMFARAQSMKYFGRVSKILGGSRSRSCLGHRPVPFPGRVSSERISGRPHARPATPRAGSARAHVSPPPCADQNRRDAMGSGWYRANNQSLRERPMIVAALRVDGENPSSSPTWPDKV